MDSRLTILEELGQISPLVAGISPVTPYVVPEGYFEGFASELMERIKAGSLDPKEELESLSPLLSSISRQVPYELPDNYFVDLSDQALVGAKAIEFVNDELENLSPLMSSLKSKNVYEVPDGYFETLAQHILVEAKKQQRPAKVIALMPMRKVMRYAVAAIVIGIIAVGAWLIQEPDGTSPNIVKVESGIQKASDEEILNFIQDDDDAPITEAVVSTDDDMDESDVKAMLADISDNELEQFANEFADQNNTLSN